MKTPLSNSADSIFINDDDDRATPLLSAQYDPLFEDDDDDESSGGYYRSVRDELITPLWGNEGDPTGDPTETAAECFFDDMYRYYWARGLWKFIAQELSQIVILSWLVLFCIFLGTCVDYAGISAYTTTTTTTTNVSLWQFIGIQHRSMNWFYVVALVLYSVYAIWCVVKFVRDVHRMRKMRQFYHTKLEITDFALRTARWSDVVMRLSRVVGAPHRVGTVCALSDNNERTSAIASLVTKKQNCFQLLLRSGLVDFTFEFGVLGYSAEFAMLTRSLQWNLMQIVNFFFDVNLQYRTNLNVRRLQRRIVLLAVINLLLLPFLIVFVALYALFRYGEQFYKDPGSAGARQWSLAAKWYFRAHNEMPHVLEERLRLSAKYADQYTRQFAAGALQPVARAIAFASGSIVVWLLLLSIINEHVLISLELSSGKAVLWWVTILSSVWAVCRGVLHEQHVFYPRAALEVVHEIVRKLPPHFLENANTKHVNRQFRQLYPLRVVTLLQEFFGLLVTPYIMLSRVRPAAQQIIDCVQNSIEYSQLLHFHTDGAAAAADCSGSAAATGAADYDEDAVLRSEHLVPHLRKLD